MANNVYCDLNHKVLYFDYYETDKLSMFNLSIMVDELRVQKVNYFSYFHFFMLRPDVEIAKDCDVLRLANFTNKDGEFEIFLDA